MTFRRGLYTAGTRVRWETLEQWLAGLEVMLAHKWRRRQIRAHVCALAETPEVIRVADAATCTRVTAIAGGWPVWTHAARAAIVAEVRARLMFLRGDFVDVDALAGVDRERASSTGTGDKRRCKCGSTLPAGGWYKTCRSCRRRRTGSRIAASPASRSTSPTPAPVASPASSDLQPPDLPPWVRYADDLHAFGVRPWGSPAKLRESTFDLRRCLCGEELWLVPCSCRLERQGCGHCWNGPSLLSHWPSERYRWVCVFCRMMIGGGEAVLMWPHALAELQRRCGNPWRASTKTSTEYHTERLALLEEKTCPKS